MPEPESTKKRFKSTYILAIIFLILVGVFFLTKGPSKEKESGGPELFFKDLNIDLINKIEITKTTKKTVLEEEDGIWYLTSSDHIKAKQEDIKAMLDSLRNLKVGDIVSENPTKQNIFEVDKNGIEVKLYQEEELLTHFYIGKSGSNFSSNYIRKEGSNKVYLTKTIISFDFDRADYRDLSILNFDQNKVQGFSIKHKKAAMELEKQEDDWKFIKPKAEDADDNPVKAFLGRLSDYKASDILSLDKVEDVDFEGPAIELVLVLAGDYKVSLVVGSTADKNIGHYARIVGQDTAYLISQSQYDDLEKKVENFKPTVD